jgi:putative transcriptional regulator
MARSKKLFFGLKDREGGENYLEGQILIAMPGMGDPRFERAVVYLCAHTNQGAMGFVVNKSVDHFNFSDLLDHLNIEGLKVRNTPIIHFGGPVDSERGFVLHSSDYCSEEATLQVDLEVGLTATVDILKAIANGNGPSNSILALGYTGWAPGQLEGEIRANGWLCCEADESLLFGQDNDSKWTSALSKLGVDASLLSSKSGNA